MAASWLTIPLGFAILLLVGLTVGADHGRHRDGGSVAPVPAAWPDEDLSLDQLQEESLLSRGELIAMVQDLQHKLAKREVTKPSELAALASVPASGPVSAPIDVALQPGSPQQEDTWWYVGEPWRLSAAGDWQPQYQNGSWSEPPEHIIADDGNLAFFTAQAFSSFSAKFSFRMLNPWTGAAFLFGATNSSQFYQIEFPLEGQQARAEHAWVTLSAVDSAGVRTALAPLHGPIGGVTSQPGVEHTMELTLAEDSRQLSVIIDGRPIPPYTLPAHARGYVGFGTYNLLGTGSRAAFAGAKITGASAAVPPFGTSSALSHKWKNISNACEPSTCDKLVRTPAGDLLCDNSGPGLGPPGCSGFIRSSDNGSSWEWVPKVRHVYGGAGHLRVTKAGLLESYAMAPPLGTPVTIVRSQSTDNGNSFAQKGETGFQEVATISLEVPADPSDPASLAVNRSELIIGGPIVGLSMSNDDLLLFGVAHTAHRYGAIGDRFYYFGAGGLPFLGINWCIRSTDGGKSFSKPINLDGQPSAPFAPRNPSGAWDRTFPRGEPMQALEISTVETKGSGVLALIRAASSPWMWEGRSSTSGETWEPLRRGQFPLYACFNAILRLRSGGILICGAFPAVSCQLSWDDGMSWSLFTIDVSGVNVQGSLIEVDEDDTVLFVYGGRSPSAGALPYGLRSAKFHVTQGPSPTLTMLDH